nr:hypothetical protein [Tanacetum cinerariifolium]
MARLAFCDYHNMIAILEKSEHNVDFHQIVDFVEASHIRIKTTDEGTKILAIVDGKPMSIFESSIRRNLKLNDEVGISTLPDAELFENLALMKYNILPNQKFTFQKGQFSHQWKYLIHTIMQCLSSKSIDFNEFSSNIATAVIAQSKALPTAAYEPASPLGDVIQGEACPTVSGLVAGHDRANIIKTSALPHDTTPRVTSLAVDEGSMQQQLHELTDLCTHLQRRQTEMSTKIAAQDLEISSLKARIKLLEDKDKGTAELSGDDAPIKGEFEDRGGSSGVQALSVPSVTEIPNVGVPTGSGLVPTASPIFTTASVVTPYSRRKGEKIEWINELVKYQDHHAKILKYQAQQRKLLSKKQQREFYMSVLRSHSGWKTRQFKGMTLEEIREKFIPVWKKIEDFVPMASKKEGERMKRKGLRLEHESAKKMKTSEEVSKEYLKEMMQLVPVEELYVEALQVKHPIIVWEIHSEGERNNWKIIRLGGHTAVYQFFVDMLKHFDREDLNQLWTLIPLPEYFPTASEEVFPLLSQRDAPAEEVCTAVKTRVNRGQRHINIIQRCSRSILQEQHSQGYMLILKDQGYIQGINQDLKKALNFEDTLSQALMNKNFLKEH